MAYLALHIFVQSKALVIFKEVCFRRKKKVNYEIKFKIKKLNKLKNKTFARYKEIFVSCKVTIN